MNRKMAKHEGSHPRMGANAARHTMEIVDNVRHVIVIEFLTAAQAIDLRPDGPARLGHGSAAAFTAVRDRVPFLENDRETTSDIETLAHLIKSGVLLEATWSSLETEAH